jgi:PAS domain S-box-containing protein
VHLRLNGEEFHAEVLLSPFTYGGETILQSTVRDITERKRSEMLYRILAEGSVGVVFIVQDGKFRFINKRAIAYTGYTEDIRDRDADFMIHPGDKAMCSAYAREMLKGTRTTAYEYRIVTKENKVRWISQILTPIVHEGRPAILGNALDVTDLKESRARLEEIQALESSIMSAIPHVVVGLQNDSILFVNHAAEDVFGWKPEELIGSALDIFCQNKNECLDLLGRLLAETASEALPRRETEIHCRHRDGRNIVCRVTSCRIGEAAGDKIVAIFEDITDKKMPQIQLLQAEKMASIGKLAAGVAHEINNPTAFVSSNLNTLSEYMKDMIGVSDQYRALMSFLKNLHPGDGLSATIGDRVRQIEAFEAKVKIDDVHEDAVALIAESREGTGRISRIVQDLKNFAHPGEEKETAFNVNENIESTLNIVWNELKYKAVVHKDYGDIPRIMGYPQQLNQVFMNILVNAAQAIPEKGEIRIATKADGGDIEITISDTGVGIPPENLPKLFDPFFTTKEVGKGTGLGLHVAYSIIEKHRGSIAVDSTVGAGTTFTVRIPIQYND